ncbi:Bug family tripartite tricarboxylate transporter substrate binding protein [Roseomonas populi]|uniref:Tripartite tricarboxylate transporter substrate binding protein n=1 Tax=Roseomonas populi TaxID=3121582 RepID=A0ABT1XA18_9PROT|nr:tripartite tricarboxylate transporter substrate binding protein [Roseomonas pecuniae]MCR0983824.1 tripartite tricarboxylate transporter substrate binding protein [Roseomonas pecuniae]
MRRRTFLAGPALAAPVLTTLARPALAQAFPARPLRMIVPFGPGGISDLVARIVAEATSPILGQPVVVENRTGAGGNIAAEAAARAQPDGYTVLFCSIGMLAVNPVLYRRLPFDPAKDFSFVAPLADTPHILVVRPGLLPDGAGLREFIALARSEPRRLTWSTAGAGSSPHQTLALLQFLGGAELTAVHYRSGAAGVQAVLAGEVSATAEATPVVVEHIRAGTLRALVAAVRERLALLPETPGAAEAGMPGLVNGSSAGIVLPRATPEPVRAVLEDAFTRAMASSEIRVKLAAQGTVPLGGGAATFAEAVTKEGERWRRVLAGMTLD